MVTAYTLNSINEAIGVARAARSLGMPAAISFTVETNGRLVKGETLREAIETVDRETDGAPEYFLINCAHPTHFEDALKAGEAWTERIHGVRANASTKSHAELDESETLDSGDPSDLGRRYLKLRGAFPKMRILGGCCGTDHRHAAGHLRCLRAAAGAQRLTKLKWPGLLPAIFICDDLSYRRGGAVPGGGGGSDACPPLSSGVMLRMVTRRLIALGPSICSFRYCSP